MKNTLAKSVAVSLGWFLLVNAGIFIQSNLSFTLLGFDQMLDEYNFSLLNLSLIIASVGMAGAILMLLASKPVVRFFLNAKLVEENSTTKVQQLNLIVDEQSSKAGIRPPGLAIYPSDEINAFAIGTGPRHSMLVVSQHLLDSLTLDELSAVVGHEITHIANGDMLTLSLIQGMVNTCVHFPAHVIGTLLDKLLFRGQHETPVTRFLTYVLQFCLGGIASLIVMYFSRRREFTADRGGARLAGYPEMLAALRSLQTSQQHDPSMYPFAVLGLNGSFMASGFWRYFSSHPSIQERIEALTRAR